MLARAISLKRYACPSPIYQRCVQSLTKILKLRRVLKRWSIIRARWNTSVPILKRWRRRYRRSGIMWPPWSMSCSRSCRLRPRLHRKVDHDLFDVQRLHPCILNRDWNKLCQMISISLFFPLKIYRTKLNICKYLSSRGCWIVREWTQTPEWTAIQAVDPPPEVI